ncbi:hypothetical protein Y032_0058g2878 [Ancylostoma ceylanicum]|uniref:Uncharacterized protein n=1 Tax=Ancylostoma ceylanicum TaxID=53326 RepID=A0A016U5K7_9BILA|nr:hypothetical protein Y032_0058g2878 [Ancylostoma ceylanicum]
MAAKLAGRGPNYGTIRFLHDSARPLTTTVTRQKLLDLGWETAQESLKCYGVQARRICAPIGIVGPDSPVVQCTTRAALLQAPLRHQSTLIFFPGSAPDPLRSPFAVRPFYEAQLAPGRRILGPDSLV